MLSRSGGAISIRRYANIDKSNPTQKTPAYSLDDQLKVLQVWIKNFNKGSIPKALCNVSFTRSSGPGGQNVNKLNTKAEIRLNVYEVEKKLNWPLQITDALLAQYHDGDVIITSQRYRTQTQNLEDAWEKMSEFIKNIVRLPGQTSMASKERIEILKQRDKANVREWKTKRSEKKRLRKNYRRYEDDD